MDYYKLGNSDLKVSEVSFGCMSLELEKGQAHVSNILRSAHDEGINFFDTANLYDQGLNEKMVGKALNPIREDIIIATKVGNIWREDGSGWDWNPSKEHILTEVNESLRRLQTDYIDLYMLHGGTIDDPVDEIIEAFERLQQRGKIRAYGISSIRPNTIRKWVEKSSMDSVMMQYSLLDRRPEEEALALLQEHDISVITRGTLAKGLLVDKAPKSYLGYSKAEVKEIQMEVNKLEHASAAAIRYVLHHPAVASSVIGIRTKQHLKDIIKATDIHLSDHEIQQLQAVLKPNRYSKHR